MVLTDYYKFLGLLGVQDAGISHSTCDENLKSHTVDLDWLSIVNCSIVSC